MNEFLNAGREISLSGTWKVLKADEDARRLIADPELDDKDWLDIKVPGLWRSCNQLSDADSVLYRRHFELDQLPEGNRRWLVIDGLCYQGDIWFDGAYLGDTEGYFVEHNFEITQATTLPNKHLLAIEANCETPSDRTNKRNITGVLQHSDSLNQDLNPGGLWRDIRIEETGPIRIDDLRVLVLEADDDRAIIRIGGVLDSAATANVEVLTTVTNTHSIEHSQEMVLARGRNEIEWHVAVEKPDLWWPFSLGAQPLYEVQVAVKFNQKASDTRSRRTGLRSFELKNWIASVNGEQIFLKGTNFGPGNADLSAITQDDYRRDLTLAKNAGLDLVRVHGHVAHPDLYAEADKLGILIFQDFPLQWSYSRSIRTQAARQATALVHQYGHHPSIVLWNSHNEPYHSDRSARHHKNLEGISTYGPLASLSHQIPSWNRSILDRSVKRSFDKADPTRPAIAHSGVAPHLPQLDGTDSHLWFGWRHGKVSDLKVLASRLPRLLRFVSEFGAQSVPHDDHVATVCEAPNFPQINLQALSEDLGAELELINRYAPLDGSTTWEAWVDSTQTRQAHLVRHTIEVLRTLKYKPTGGFCQFLFADALPYVSCAVLDHRRKPKIAWDALSAANRPVIVVADLHKDEIPIGTNQCAIHVVSDLRTPIKQATLFVEWHAPGMDVERWSFTGGFEPDSVTKIAKTFLVTKNPGIATLALELRGSDIHAINNYQIKVC